MLGILVDGPAPRAAHTRCTGTFNSTLWESQSSLALNPTPPIAASSRLTHSRPHPCRVLVLLGTGGESPREALSIEQHMGAEQAAQPRVHTAVSRHRARTTRRTSATPQQSRELGESIDRLLADGREYRRSKDYADLISFIGRFRQYAPFNAVTGETPETGRPGTWQRTRSGATEYKRVLHPGARPLVMMQPGGPSHACLRRWRTPSLCRERLAFRAKASLTPSLTSSLLSEDVVERRWRTTVRQRDPR